jgi:2-iminobutanoate/2-iminopropanoate deaminase
MKTKITPAGIAEPASAYVHGLLTEAPAKLLTLSGQLGERPDGICEAGAAAQAHRAWANVQAILDEAGMTLQDIIKVTSYIVGQENISAYVEAHKAVLGELKPPWTLVVVQALGAPQYLIEVNVTAAR